MKEKTIKYKEIEKKKKKSTLKDEKKKHLN